MGIASKVRHLVEHHISGNGVEFCEDGDKLRAGSRRMRDANTIVNLDTEQDYIAFTHLLEHYDNPRQIIENAFSKLRTGGRLLLVLPHKNLYPGPGDPGNPTHKFECDENDIISMAASTNASYSLVARGVDDGGSLSFFVVFEKVGESDGERKHIRTDLGERDVRYCVVIPYKDQAEMTERCVQSLKDAKWKPAQVVLVDDASNAPVPDDSAALKGLNVLHVHNEKNEGFPVSVNRGVQASDFACRVVVLLNNDTVALPGGDRLLLSPLADASVAMTGQQGGKLGREFEHTGDGDDYIEFYCAAVRRSVWDEMEGLDESFSPGYGEDSDFGIRVKRAGYTTYVVGSGVCEHLRHQSFKRGPVTNRIIESHRKKLIKKHHRGDALFCVASHEPSGGIKVIWNCARALQDAGYRVGAMLCTQSENWPKISEEWARFDNLYTVPSLKSSGYEFDHVIGTFYSTWPYAHKIPAQRSHIGLVQSDEPRWTADSNKGPNKEAMKCFGLDRFKCIVVADYMYEFEKKYGMNIVGKIDNGVDSRIFYPDDTFGRRWSRTLLTIRKGSHVWFDGQEVADEAAALLAERYDDFYYIILGSRYGWNDWQEPSYSYEWVQTHNEDEVRKLYNRAGAYVIPSRIEGSSLTAIEAMACGTPVVCTKIASDAAVHEETALVVPYDDPVAIADAVSRVFDDTTLRDHLYHEGTRVAFERTHERQREQFVALVEGTN